MKGTQTMNNPTSDEDYIRRLVAAHHARKLAPFRRWRYPAVDPAVVALTEGSTREDYRIYALTGKAFTLWHSGRTDPHYGREGTGLGKAMRQIGRAGAYGPRDPGAVRALDGLVLAETSDSLAAALDKVSAKLSGSDHPPHWATLIEDLRQWHNRATRDDVRLRWAQQFHTNAPKAEPAPR